MPELPEVETIKNSLQPVNGKRVMRSRELHPDIVKRRDFPPTAIDGQLVTDVYRRGKYLVFRFDASHFMVVHLGMSGRFYWAEPDAELARHTHFVLEVEGNRELRFEDPRRFGGIRFIADVEEFFHAMGPEPLSRGFNRKTLRSMLANRKTPIKNLLLNQSMIAGIGNIYADEILFAARLHPLRPAGSLTAGEIDRLHLAIREVLTRGIAYRGTTFRDYRDGQNRPGSFQELLSVYSRQGQPCPICGGPIEKTVVGGRGTHYCPACQG